MAGKGKSAPRRKKAQQKKKRQPVKKRPSSRQSLLPFVRTEEPAATSTDLARDEDALEPLRTTSSASSSTSEVRKALGATTITSSRKRSSKTSEEEPAVKRRNAEMIVEEEEDSDGVSPMNLDEDEDAEIADEAFSEGCSYDADISLANESVFVDENDLSEVRNTNFANYERALNSAAEQEPANKPPQLTEELCDGGDPVQAWNLMCRKDDITRVDAIKVASAVRESPRAILIDWMMEVCENEKQHRETFHLAVNYLDKFFATTDEVHTDALQCLGTAALFIASKYEEIYPPRLDQFVEYTDGACTSEEVHEAELLILGRLNWSITLMTSVHWLHMYFQLMGSSQVETEGEVHVTADRPRLPSFYRDHFVNAAKILDVAVLDPDHLQFSNRQLAAGVLFLCYEPYDHVQKVTGYAYEEMTLVIEWLKPCFDYCLRHQQVGDPMPSFSDVSMEEWYSIQTHGDLLNSDTLEEVREYRYRERLRISETKKKISKRAPPLRMRAPNSTSTA